MFNGVLGMPPATGVNYASFLLVGFVFRTFPIPPQFLSREAKDRKSTALQNTSFDIETSPGGPK
jgi:hypothetical protein